jgi:NTE family protein
MTTEGYKFGLALSGGGSRAAAFHLGCMRALNDRGILDQVRTLSTVSGGSVIGALWAYTDDSFEEFDVRMQAMLRKGLKGGIVRFTLLSKTTLKIVATVVSSGLIAAVGSIISLATSLLRVMGVPNSTLRKLKNSLQAPFPRFASRTTAFADFLDNEFFKGATLKDIKRKNLQIIINATELRTESAYRFG